MGRLIKKFFSLSAQAFVSLFILLSLSFFLMKAFPGNPLLDEFWFTPEGQRAQEMRYGLNLPLSEQYFAFLSRLAHADFGPSIAFSGKSVNEIIKERWPVTFKIGLGALLLTVALSLSFSLFFAQREKKYYHIFSLSFLSLPTLMIAPLLIWLFALKLDWLPVALIDSTSSYILPIVILSLRPTALLTRVLSAHLHDVLEKPYILTAKAYGFSQKTILMRWALKNSLSIFIQQLMPIAANLLVGSFLVEKLFAIPGIGNLFLDSLRNRDFSLIAGLCFIFGLFLILGQWLADLLTINIDQRIRLNQEEL